MAAIVLPRLPSNWQDQPVFFTRAWNDAMSKIETLLNQITSIPEIQTALAGLDTAVTAATTAAANANAAAATAGAAAATANGVATAVTASSSLANSYVTPTNALTSTSNPTTARIDIAANTRTYGDGTTASVDSGSLPGLSLSTLYYVYYDDPNRTGGAVTYVATTDPTVAAQTGDRHTMGSVTTPAASSTTTGAVVSPPGVGSIHTQIA